jgi:nucleoid-associated protein YgaU
LVEENWRQRHQQFLNHLTAPSGTLTPSRPMEHRGNRTTLALSLLVVVWIITYWLWQPRSEREPLVTFPDRADALVAPSPQDPQPQDHTPEREPQVDPPEGGSSPPDTTTFGEPPFRWYTVRDGDSAERIATRELGSAQLWTSIARANPLKDIQRLTVGERIKIPLDPANPQGRSDDPPPAPPVPATVEYIVRSGDTLSGIASQFYGSVRFVDHLYAANRDRLRNKNDLRVGQTLVIPPKPADSP